MPAPKLSKPEEQLHLCELYRKGTKLSDMARILGVHTSTIRDRARQFGLPGRRLPKPVPKEVEKQLRAMVKEGLSQDTAAMHLGVTVHQLRRAEMVCGIQRTWRTHAVIKDPVLRTKFVDQKYAERWTIEQLAAYYKCSKKAILSANRRVKKLVAEGELVLPAFRGTTLITMRGDSETQADTIKRLWLSGTPRAEMLAELKMGYNTIIRRVRMMGLPMRRPTRHRKPPFTEQRLREMAARGYNRVVVAKTLKVALSTVQKWEQIWGIERSRGRCHAILPEEVMNDFYQMVFVQKTPYKQVASYFGCHYNTVRKMKKRVQALLDRGVKPGTLIAC